MFQSLGELKQGVYQSLEPVKFNRLGGIPEQRKLH